MYKYQLQMQNVFDELGQKLWPIFEQLSKLTEEAGELNKAISVKESSQPYPYDNYMTKFWNEEDHKDKIQEEVGDCLFTLMCISNTYSIDSEKALIGAIQKFIRRMKGDRKKTG